MPRPRICRRIMKRPRCNHFKPVGVQLKSLGEVILTVEEYEVIRLIDLNEMEQSDAGRKMKISQPTLSRLLNSARKKIAEALIRSKAIRIKGGNFEMVRQKDRRIGLGRGQNFGGRGRMGGFSRGPGGICKCPKCGYKESQVRGIPCMNKKCPKCHTKMIRE